ncbi:hypothetical protein GCM10018785_11530 [Streptomyces longispororuber]|uniref:Uncharacterized protein n=1 Tax=Streptomyces longispororuber TaxID=68230 RepID=A0A918ZBU2_9ACTN|nr:hypothetical protein GCM10018785_11530 [Streptomyces longispororuber]
MLAVGCVDVVSLAGNVADGGQGGGSAVVEHGARSAEADAPSVLGGPGVVVPAAGVLGVGVAEVGGGQGGGGGRSDGAEKVGVADAAEVRALLGSVGRAVPVRGVGAGVVRTVFVTAGAGVGGGEGLTVAVRAGATGGTSTVTWERSEGTAAQLAAAAMTQPSIRTRRVRMGPAFLCTGSVGG